VCLETTGIVAASSIAPTEYLSPTQELQYRDRGVTARAPGKVNLILRVGPPGADGFHPVVSVFQAVDLWEQVTVTMLPPGSGIRITASGPGAKNVPLDSSNLVYKAAVALAARVGADQALAVGQAYALPDVVTGPNLAIHIEKGVPVAGGMAGGSADAAATLVACNELWQAGLLQSDLLQIAADLGSDVPFCLLGGTAIGEGRGHLLTPITVPGAPKQYWAFAIQNEGLSTPAVFKQYDLLNNFTDLNEIGQSRQVLEKTLGNHALDPKDIVNDLQAAALDLRPELVEIIQIAEQAGAIRAFVSGSGPTIAALADSEVRAQHIASAWLTNKVAAKTATAASSPLGAHLVKL